MKLTEEKLKQMIIEMMYTPRNLQQDAIRDPDVHPQIKNLLKSDSVKDRRTGLSLLQTLYPEKYESDIKYSDPERAEMAAKARKAIEDHTIDIDHTFKASIDPGQKHFMQSAIDSPGYEHEFKQRNRPIGRLEYDIKNEDREFKKAKYADFFIGGRVEAPIIYSVNRRRAQRVIVESSNDTNKDLKIMSAFAEFLQRKGYFVSQIESVSYQESYKFIVFLDQETKDSYTRA